MENPISISNLNDFIFCPVSIYFHALDAETEKMSYQSSAQLNGSAAHEKSDTGQYSSRKDVLQGVSVYCEKYNLIGKIDTFDCRTGILTERKNKILKIYDGYIFQLYGQYFALTEMGYQVKELRLYSISDNKVYPVDFPEDNVKFLQDFEQTIRNMNDFSCSAFRQTNAEKCSNCIYEELCSYSLQEPNK